MSVANVMMKRPQGYSTNIVEAATKLRRCEHKPRRSGIHQPIRDGLHGDAFKEENDTRRRCHYPANEAFAEAPSTCKSRLVPQGHRGGVEKSVDVHHPREGDVLAPTRNTRVAYGSSPKSPLPNPSRPSPAQPGPTQILHPPLWYQIWPACWRGPTPLDGGRRNPHNHPRQTTSNHQIRPKSDGDLHLSRVWLDRVVS
jgi:hypothetical protein